MDRIKTYTLLAKPYWLKINFNQSHLELVKQSLRHLQAKYFEPFFLKGNHILWFKYCRIRLKARALERILCWQQIHHIFFYAGPSCIMVPEQGYLWFFMRLSLFFSYPLRSVLVVPPPARTAANALFWNIVLRLRSLLYAECGKNPWQRVSKG